MTDTTLDLPAILAGHREWLASGGERGSRADLRGAVLPDADLRDADLRDADLSRADLRGAVLRDADLRGADLSGADLSGAVLSGAVLRDADLRGAVLRDAVGIIDLGYPNGWRAAAWLRDGTVMTRVGCRNFSLAEGREYWRGKPDRREVMAALDYAEAVARIRGWIAEKRETV